MNHTTFQDIFFTRAMNQQFNSIANDDNGEPPIRIWLRATQQL